MILKYEIAQENLKNIEIKQIALNTDKFGVLVFDRAYPLLNEVRRILVEYQELGYETKLTKEEINEVHSFRKKLLEFLKRINSIEPQNDASFNRDFRDSLERDIEGFCERVLKTLRPNLVFLRQEAALVGRDSQELVKHQKAALQAQQEYATLANQLKHELVSLQERKKEIESSHGEVAAITLGKHFENQISECRVKRDEWLKKRTILFWSILCILVINLLLYAFLLVTHHLDSWPRMEPKEFFTIQYGVAKLALLAILSYAIGFASRNYNINAGLVATNQHRKNVAETLINVFSSPLDDIAKGQLTKEGATAMFRHLSVGYIRKENQNDNGPVVEIIKKVVPGAGNE
jgi:hypothetical protein